MNNTPETDARVWSDHSEGILYEVVEASFARRLERERDDALSQIYQAECRAERFCQERDEVEEKAERYRLEANAMMLQRDEARMKLQ